MFTLPRISTVSLCPVSGLFHFCKFSLANEDRNFAQVDFSLDEVKRLQDQGPTPEDVSTILELEQRTYENGQQV
jgi:hypothetical protein